jgi:microsomal epoxide hydrolase
VPQADLDDLARRLEHTIYWLNATAGSSARYYKSGNEGWGEPEPPSPVPTAIAVLPYDIGSAVRRITEQNHEIVRWTEYERGGHFAGMEEPDLAADLRESFRANRR